jgi:hypothetical protein
MSTSPPKILFQTIPFCKTKLRYGDLLKLFVPISWAIFGLLAMLAYFFAPVARGDSPRWGTMALVAAAIVPGAGAAITVWKHHRYEVYTELSTSLIAGGGGAEREFIKFRDIKAELKCEAMLAIFVLAMSFFSMIFFSAIAPSMNACAHATCGADVSWSGVTFCGALIWCFAIRLALLWSNKASVNAIAAQIEAFEAEGGSGSGSGSGNNNGDGIESGNSNSSEDVIVADEADVDVIITNQSVCVSGGGSAV